MLTLPLGIGSLIMGSLYAPTVVTGIHQMYTAIDIGQIAKYGVTYWLPLASAANVAQGAAALAVGIKSKDKKIKSLALPSSLSAFMGITEPAICKHKILQAVHRRMYRWRMWSFVCIPGTSRS